MGMIDRKNVIDELNTDVLPFLQHHCDMQCCREKRWISKMIITVDNAIALLKEQEAVEPINSYGTLRCGNCENIVGYNDGYGRGYQNNFCSKCGKAVKWDA